MLTLVPAATALLIVVVLGLFCLPRTISASELNAIGGAFRFARFPLTGLAPASRSERSVHPSVKKLSAWASSVGAAVALSDLDGDGVSNDIVQIDPRTDLVTVQGVPGTPSRYDAFFLDVPKESGAVPTGALVADFNEDGSDDVLVYFWGRTPYQFIQDPGAASEPLSGKRFHRVELVTSGERWFTSAACVGDLDGDGHQDLVLGNYFQDGADILNPTGAGIQTLHDSKAKSFNGGHKHFFLWSGLRKHEGLKVPQFQEVKSVLSDPISRGWTLAMGAADLDGDQLPELYIANDYGPDRLLHNRSKPGHLVFAPLEGKRSFTTPASCVLGQDSFKGMGVDFQDFNQDGVPDICVSNITSKFGLYESNFLWLSKGDTSAMRSGYAPFEEKSDELGTSRSGWSWDCRMVDLNNDGKLEIIHSAGFLKGRTNRWPELQSIATANNRLMIDPRNWPALTADADVGGGETNKLFAQFADGRYYDVAAQAGIGDASLTRGIAVGDPDGDGDLDLVMSNQWQASCFFRNDSTRKGKFLGLRLLLPVETGATMQKLNRLTKVPGTIDAIGATATLEFPDGRRCIAGVDGGSGHSGKRGKEILFGLGNVRPQDNVQVTLRWRDRQGKAQAKPVIFEPGWHTIVLGNTAEKTL